MFSRVRSALIVCSVALLVLGCEDTEVRKYRVPKEKAAKAMPRAHPPISDPHPFMSRQAKDDGVQKRMLAAIFLREERVWFFKVSGPTKDVTPEKDRFAEFIKSVRFGAESADGRPSLKWTVPETWKHVPGSGMRHATFLIGDEKDGLQLTVIPLGGSGARSVLQNVNRWRGQVGLKRIADAELGTCTEKIQVDGQEAVLVDLEGPPPKK